MDGWIDGMDVWVDGWFMGGRNQEMTLLLLNVLYELASCILYCITIQLYELQIKD